DAPHAILDWIEVREYAQNPFAVIRPRGKGVDVQPRIVLAPGQGASDGGLRAKARARVLDVRRVAREEPRHQLPSALSIPGDHLRQRGQAFRASARAFQLLPFEADVLRPIVGPRWRQEAALVARQLEREAGQ